MSGVDVLLCTTESERFVFRSQITGAGHGIGRELALKYASLGATVICLDLNPQGNQETVNDIKKLGATAVHAYQYDNFKLIQKFLG